MYTGIVQAQRPVIEVTERDGLRRLVVHLGSVAEGLAVGASVALNGACVTAAAIGGDGLVAFDVSDETIGRTNLGNLKEGHLVNIERSMRAGDEIGGHDVSGHVSTTGAVVDIERAGANQRTWIEVDEAWMPYLHLKGFVALDGASLTISQLDHAHHRFAISLIPETLARTTFGWHVVGDTVNVEIEHRTQIIVDTIRQFLADPAAVTEFGEARRHLVRRRAESPGPIRSDDP